MRRAHYADLDAARAEGIRIIDVRDERAAVHMAQAQAELTGDLALHW